MEPDFDISLNNILRQELTKETKVNFNYYNSEFANDSYFNSTIGILVEMTSWYFFDFDTQFSSDDGYAYGKEMVAKSLVIDRQNPMALLLNRAIHTADERRLVDLFFEDIKKDKNPIFYKGTIPANYFESFYLNMHKYDV